MSAPQSAPQVVYVRQQPTDGLCIASFVCALFGLNIVAVVLGHMGMSRVRRTGAAGSGFAIAGLIIGYITLASIVLVVLISVAAVWFGLSQA